MPKTRTTQRTTPKPTTLASALRQRRKDEGHRQVDAAEAMGIDQSTLAKWEAGAMPATNRMQDVADYLGMPFAEVASYYVEDRRTRHGEVNPERDAQINALTDQVSTLTELVVGMSSRLDDLTRLVGTGDHAPVRRSQRASRSRAQR